MLRDMGREHVAALACRRQKAGPGDEGDPVMPKAAEVLDGLGDPLAIVHPDIAHAFAHPAHVQKNQRHFAPGERVRE